MSPRAVSAIRESSVIAGYKLYLEHVRHLIAEKEIVSSGMKKEKDRCGEAVQLAREGQRVSLISSGDSGVYGMAGLAIEMAESANADIDIEIVPGITAASAAAAKLGAPLMLDFACISLSDLLVPWKVITRRLEAVAAADLVVVLYNPKSKKRTSQIEQASDMFLKHRSPKTPVGVCTALGSEDEKVETGELGTFLDLDINMRSIVIIGNTTTRIINGKMVTLRGYSV